MMFSIEVTLRLVNETKIKICHKFVMREKSKPPDADKYCICDLKNQSG